jgi:hypothetical protein
MFCCELVAEDNEAGIAIERLAPEVFLIDLFGQGK